MKGTYVIFLIRLVSIFGCQQKSEDHRVAIDHEKIGLFSVSYWTVQFSTGADDEAVKSICS